MADTQYFIPVVVEVIPASLDQEPVLANLFELYAHDMSEFMDVELGADGRFGYKFLSSYWKDEGRYPFLIKVRGNLAGFALVRRGSQISGDENVMDMAEFFIIRGFRRLGVGTKAACDIWRRFPGKWSVRVREHNRPAKIFWEGTLVAFTGKTIHSTTIQKGEELWQVFYFIS
jgi:predicted acetyltransferase